MEGETGRLVPVTDAGALAAALGELVRDGKLRRKLGKAGRARALDLYDEARVVEKQLTLLHLKSGSI